MTEIEQFYTNGFSKIKLLDDELLNYLKTGLDAHRELIYRVNNRKWYSDDEEDLFAFNDDQIPRSFSGYSIPMFETLLFTLKSKFEQVIQRSLDPCYTYTRIYYPNAYMAPHRDRPSCEFSSTINIYGGHEWPIYITGYNGETSEIILEPGTGIVYNGTECLHWRNENPGDLVYQTFLHYVDSNGYYKDYIFDKRKFLYISR